jgi:hypothetical protein
MSALFKAVKCMAIPVAAQLLLTPIAHDFAAVIVWPFYAGVMTQLYFSGRREI